MYKSILITGPGCCGATLNYNIVRFILIYNKKEYVVVHATTTNPTSIITKKNDKIILLKKHHIQEVPIESVSAKNKDLFVFVPKRDIRSIMSCSKRRWPNRFKHTSLLTRATEEVYSFDLAIEKCKQTQMPLFVFQYELYMQDPLLYIQIISKKLGFDVDSQWVIDKIDKITASDKDALFEHNRIGAKKTDDFSYLNLDEQQQLKNTFPDWIWNDN